MKKIEFSKNNYTKIIEHCRRKLNEEYYNDETKEQQAFGVIIGRKEKEKLVTTKVYPLKINYRYNKKISNTMNNLIKNYAIPGKMKIRERAWAADPLELSNILCTIEENEIFLGTYHMHHDFSWNGDYPKQLPTDLDRELVKDSNLIMFIVYIGNGREKDVIRGFYEAKIDLEYEINKI